MNRFRSLLSSNKAFLTCLALFLGGCASSGSELSHRIEPRQIGGEIEVIILPARSVPVAFKKSQAKGDVDDSSANLRVLPFASREEVLAVGVLNLASLEWGSMYWEEAPETLPAFNVGLAVSEACISVLMENVPEIASVRMGPDWKLSESELVKIYGGTFEETRFTFESHVPHGRYSDEGAITHGPEWVTSHYPLKSSPGKRTWLLEPLIVFAVVGPTGFTLQSFFHLYDLETGKVLAQKYPDPWDINQNRQTMGVPVETTGDSGVRYSTFTVKTALGLVSKDEQHLRVSDSDIQDALKRAATDIAWRGMFDLGLIRSEGGPL
jgi:hypothetical protein